MGIKNNPHIPTDITRAVVESHAILGTPQEGIAALIGISDDTLRKHYREILDNAKLELDAKLCGVLVQKALRGEDASLFFYLKTKAGFKETARVEGDLNANHTHTGAVEISPTDAWVAEVIRAGAASANP